jgi:hypothetical protein
MSKEITIEWCVSPFEHAKYTLFTSRKKMRKAGFEPADIDAPAATHLYDDEKIVVLLDKKADIMDSEKVALLVHESVHVWQEIRKRMGEKEPSCEFEAYSVQSIFLGLLSIYQGGKQ